MSQTVKGIVASLDRHIRSNNYGNSIKKGDAFDQARRVLTANTMDLRKMGKGDKPNKAQPLADDEVDKLHTTGQMGMHNPDALLRMLWFQNKVHFGMRTVTEHVNMKWGDVKLYTTNTGTEYLQYSERVTKTRTGANPGNTRDVTPKSWNNLENSDRCHVAAYKKYKELRPVKFSSDNEPFYISSNTAFDNKSTKWFKSQPAGINKISEFLKIMITNAGTFH
jgi:hypothetical protein